MSLPLPIHDFIQEQTLQRLHRVKQESRRLLETEDPTDRVDAVHDFRVSVRRLRTLLQSFQDYFRKKRVQKCRKQLRAAFRLAGAVRNRDITIELLKETQIEGVSVIAQVLMAERVEPEESLRKKVQLWLDTDFQVLDRGTEFSRKEPDDTYAADVAGHLLAWHVTNFFESGRHILNQNDVAAIHEFRIAAKQFRYLIEVFSSVYDEAVERKLKALKKLQDDLGRLNDIVTARSLIQPQNPIREIMEWLQKEEEKAHSALVTHWKEQMDLPEKEDEWKLFFSRPVGVSEA